MLNARSTELTPLCPPIDDDGLPLEATTFCLVTFSGVEDLVTLLGLGEFFISKSTAIFDFSGDMDLVTGLLAVGDESAEFPCTFFPFVCKCNFLF
jgi:hypothetical protein